MDGGGVKGRGRKVQKSTVYQKAVRFVAGSRVVEARFLWKRCLGKRWMMWRDLLFEAAVGPGRRGGPSSSWW